MSGSVLLLTYILVSWSSLVLQTAALIHLVRQRAGSDAETIAGGGYIRTAASRVLMAGLYAGVGIVQASTHVGVNTEALAVLITGQSVWLGNAVLDIRKRRRLGKLPRRREQSLERRT